MNKKRIFICAVSAVLIFIVVGIGIFATRQSANTPERLLSLGEKYLTELNYEQALVQFLKVIEIDPMNPRSYTGAAEAYVGLGQTDDAIAILRQGLTRTGNSAIQKILDDFTRNDEVNQNYSEDVNQDEDQDTSGDDASINTNIDAAAPFDFEDVSVLGYPWGVSVYELQDNGLLEDVEISENSGYLEFYHPDRNTVGNSYLRNPNIGFHENGLIQSVIIKDSDPTIGPRGTKIGMIMEDVIHLFRCETPEALDFAKNPTVDVPEVIRSYDHVFENGVYYHSSVYPFGEGIRLQYDVENQGQNAGSCQLIYNISGGVVSSIEIYYMY